MTVRFKKHLRSALIIAITLTATGCIASLRFGKGDPPIKVPEELRGVECRIYVRPGFSPLPPLPNISEEKHLTSEELNIIQANYIKELRLFILEEMEQFDARYSNYVKRCLK